MSNVRHALLLARATRFMLGAIKASSDSSYRWHLSERATQYARRAQSIAEDLDSSLENAIECAQYAHWSDPFPAIGANELRNESERAWHHARKAEEASNACIWYCENR